MCNKEDSSISEEKEAKLLHSFAPAPVVTGRTSTATRGERMKLFLFLFCSKERRRF
jgi:hypothetical protein